MKYWIFVDQQVAGPYEVPDLKKVRGFSINSMVCPAEAKTAGGKPAWQKAALVLEIAASLQSTQSQGGDDSELQKTAAQEIIASILTPSAEPPAPEGLSQQQATELIEEVLGSINSGKKESLFETKTEEPTEELPTAERRRASKRTKGLAPWMGIAGAGFVLAGLFVFMKLKQGSVAPVVPIQPAPTPPVTPVAVTPPPVVPVTVPQEPDLSNEALEWVKAYALPNSDASLGETLEAQYFVAGAPSPWKVKKTGADQYQVRFLVEKKPVYVFVAWPKLKKLEPATPKAKALLAGKGPAAPVKHPHRHPKKHLPKPKLPGQPTQIEPKKPAEPAKEQPLPVDIPKLDPQSSQPGSSDNNMNLDQLIGNDRSN